MDDPLEGQDRTEPSESSTTVDLDLQDEETSETLEKRREGSIDIDDIENDDLRQKVKQARAQAEQEAEDGVNEARSQAEDDAGSDPEPDEDVDRVRVDEGEDPLHAIAEDAFGSAEEAKEAYAEGEIGDEELDGAIEDGLENEEEGVMDGVEEDDVEDAMDMELNVVDDVDAEHFNYEDQDFSNFSNYGNEVTIDYNDVYFKLVQPSDRKQEQLINEMGGIDDEDGMSMTEMMESMIAATVERPTHIEEIVADWSPFERMGLGMQCMEFLGLDAVGNM